MILHRLASLILALAATSALAQAPAPLVVPNASTLPNSATTVLPIRDAESNTIQAFLLLEFPDSRPNALDRLLHANKPGAGIGVTIPLAPAQRLNARFSLDARSPLSVLCEGSGVTATLGSLAEHCLLSGINTPSAAHAPPILQKPHVSGELRLDTPKSQLMANFGLSRYELAPSFNLPGSTARRTTSNASSSNLLSPARIEERSIGLTGGLKLGSEGWLSIGGTWAHARLVSAAELPGVLPSRWNSSTISLGAGIGNFGGEVVSRSISIPGQTRAFNQVGLGVTWKTPWHAQLSVGAANLTSQGKNPFGLPNTASGHDNDEGRVPYVRYRQDL